MKEQQSAWILATLLLFVGVVEVAAGIKFMSDNLNVTINIRECALYYVSVVIAVLIGALAAFKIRGKYWTGFWVGITLFIILAHYWWVTVEGIDGITWLIGFPVFTAVSFILLAIQGSSIAYSHYRSRSSANK